MIHGGCGYSFKTKHKKATLCDDCKNEKYGDRKFHINKYLPNFNKEE